MNDEDTGTEENVVDIAAAAWEKRKKDRGVDHLEPAPEPGDATQHFKPLGYDGELYYFFSSRSRQVRCFKLQQLSNKTTYIFLAPLQWWEIEFPSKAGFTGRVVDQAANYLVNECFRQGVFRLERLRGLGLWWDDERSILHAGDHLIVDGEACDLSDIESRYVYEANIPLPIKMDKPLSAMEANHFYRFCNELSWDRPEYGILFAGWATIAMACGSLPWRPHLMVTGSSGCGKSWVTDKVATLLGDFAVNVKGDSSEAGIRQQMGHSALPVLWDEAEGEDERTEQNMNRVLGLMRQASADLDGKLLKGGADGKAMQYEVRSMFYLSAIRVPIQQTADHNRVTVLTLTKNPTKSHFSTTIEPMADKLTPEFCARFRARVVTYLPVLRRNIKVFSTVAGDKLGSHRMGDQIGPMLAGAFLLHTNKEATPAKAREWMEKIDWNDQEEIHNESDEDKLLTSLLEAVIVVKLAPPDHGTLNLSVGELIAAAFDLQGACTDPSTARRELRRHGIIADRARKYIGSVESIDVIYISNSHRGIKMLLKNTPWSVGWRGILRRLPGARASKDKKSFAGSQDRATLVPLSHVLGNI